MYFELAGACANLDFGPIVDDGDDVVVGTSVVVRAVWGLLDDSGVVVHVGVAVDDPAVGDLIFGCLPRRMPGCVGLGI